MKKKESSIQNLTNSSKTSGLSLEEYRKQIGEEQYYIEYHRVYSRSQNIQKYNRRYEEVPYEPDLDKIKEKYKNGVTDEILKEWLF